MKTLATCITTSVLALSAAAAWGATDSQIAGTVDEANHIEIDAGRLAQSKALSKDVQAFAQHMVSAHTDANASMTELLQKLHLSPAQDPTADKLKSGADQRLATLKTLQGSTFDRRYMDHEVYFHKAVLEELDKRLIPEAQNPELKSLLEKMRPAFQGHLEQAQKLQKEVEKTG